MLPIDYTTARQLLSSTSPEDSPYNVLWESLPNFKSLTFSDRIKLICECSLPIATHSCTIMVQYDGGEDVVYGLVHIDGNFAAFVDLTDVLSDRTATHESKIRLVRELLIMEGVFVDQHEYTIMLID